MRQVFLSNDGRIRDGWREAFPGLIAGRLDVVPGDAGVLWVLQPLDVAADTLVARLRLAANNRPLVILADAPSEEGAMAVLAAGASGYCNGHADPQVLQQVALAVGNGGVWVGQGLMQRLLAATFQSLPVAEQKPTAWKLKLTAREQEAAELVAKGASNKEIARQLAITERTVKSHVSALLEKLGARDRLQLSLIINGIET